jgi:hypothetical protein
MAAEPDRRIMAALNATGLPWSIERGKNHNKVVLAGRMVAVYSARRGKLHKVRDEKNIIGHIRKAARQDARAEAA